MNFRQSPNTIRVKWIKYVGINCVNMTKDGCEKLTVDTSGKLAMWKGFIKKYKLLNPQMFHQNIFSALLTKCRLDPLGMCSLFSVHPLGLDISKSLSFQFHSSVSVTRLTWCLTFTLQGTQILCYQPCLAICVVSKSVVQMFACFLSLSAIAGNMGVCVKWGLSGGNNFRIPRREWWLSCTTSVFSSKWEIMTPNHYLI